jgi:hypothetical protein
MGRSPLKLLAEYTDPLPSNDLFRSGFFPYAHRCTYINSMRKPFEAKTMHVHETIGDVRESVRRVGDAAHSQATLNIAPTACCVAALLVASLLVHSARTGPIQ